MANINRVAKSGSSWTQSDLTSYNITIVSQASLQFYGANLPTIATLNLDPNLLNATVHAQGLAIDTRRLLQYIDLSVYTFPKQESAIDDLSRELLRQLGFEALAYNSVLRTRHALPLWICHSKASAQTNVSLVQPQAEGNILLLQENKTGTSDHDPEPQLIAEAIAAFQFNDAIRARRGLPPLPLMTFPCIVMVGSNLSFYTVPVTRDLSEAVRDGRYPILLTIVRKHEVTDNAGMSMTELPFRRRVFRHYTAFRMLAQHHWAGFLL
jgi:hypothetical protein